jgi:2'-5' RNA ligase
VTEPTPTLTGAPWTPEPGALVFLPIANEVGFTEDEAYAFLSGGLDAVETLQASQVPAILAAADVHDGAMVAFIPMLDDLVDLALDDPAAEPLDQLHITAAYLGPAADIDEETRQLIIEEMRRLATNQPLIVARVIGFTVLNPDGPEPCLVANVSGSDIDDAHDSVIETLADMGIDMSTQHEPWLAHITLAYDADPRRLLTDDLMSSTGAIGIDRIRIAFGDVITDVPLGVYDTLAADAFHLPGKHNQKTHGHGLSEAASARERVNARALNRGETLNRKNPAEERIVRGIEGWTGGAASSNEAAGTTSRQFKDGVSYAVRHNAYEDSTEGEFARTVASAPADAPTLYRGMHGVPASEIPNAGDTFDLGPTSFTRSHRVAEDFAEPKLESHTEGHIVHVRVKKGSRALQIDQHAGAFSREREHVGMGRYKVTSRKDSTKTVKIGGKKYTVNVTELEVEQIDMDVDVSFTRTRQQAGGSEDIGALN